MICIVICHPYQIYKIDKCDKLICNLYNKKNFVVHIRSLKEAKSWTDIKESS